MPVRTGGGHNHWRDLAKAVLIKGGCIRLAHEVRSRTEASGGIMNNLPWYQGYGRLDFHRRADTLRSGRRPELRNRTL